MAQKKSKKTLSSGNYTDLVLSNHRLEIVPTERGQNHAIEVRETWEEDTSAETEFLNMIEHHLANGWEIVPPEVLGALTEGTILSDEVLRDTDGEIVLVGRCFWHANYMIDDPIDLFSEGRPIVLQEAGKHISSATYLDHEMMCNAESSGQPVNWKAFTKKWSKKLGA